MSQSLCKQLEDEMKAIVQEHLTGLAEYTTVTCPENIVISESIQGDLSTLQYYCCTPGSLPNEKIYLSVVQARQRLHHLFRLMNIPADTITFRNSQLGNLWQQVHDWCKRTAEQYELSRAAVWDSIAPVVPDLLQKLDYNLYEARWWKSVPKMDIEILLRTGHIIIEKSPFEPDDMPGSIAVQFSLDMLDVCYSVE